MKLGPNPVRAALCGISLAAVPACSKDRRPQHAGLERASTVSASSSKPPATAAASSDTCWTYAPPTEAGRVQHGELLEISGLSASRARPGVLYVHNDSGDSARFFALDSRGAALAEFSLEGASFEDCEDIALGASDGQTFVYLGDIGNNAARDGRGKARPSVQV